jgi:hypothetical protein
LKQAKAGKVARDAASDAIEDQEDLEDEEDLEDQEDLEDEEDAALKPRHHTKAQIAAKAGKSARDIEARHHTKAQIAVSRIIPLSLFSELIRIG